MSAIRDKIEKILSEHPTTDANLVKRLTEEVDYFDNNNLLNDVFVLYKKVQDNFEIGDSNYPNSALLYHLGVTKKEYDPSKPVLVEKRRTYARAGFPDIDMDFDYERRHEILEYLISKYGREHVGNIGTVAKLKTKSAVRRAIKILDPENTVRYDKRGNKIKNDQKDNFRLENTILDTLPEMMKNGDDFINSVDDACREYPEFAKYMEQYPEVRRVAARIEGSISAMGMHAAGVLLSPEPLSHICPMHVTKERSISGEITKTIATQFSMKDVESLGLIKIDILGLSTKTAISHAVKLIKDRYGIDLNLSNLPLDDKKTLSLISSGKTDGLFQLEMQGMKQTVMQIGIDSFKELIAAIAMYRPGPKDYIPMYARRKRGLEKISYAHPLMESISKNTYGILCFQEQIMQAFMSLASMSLNDGYKFTSGCAKKIQDVIESYTVPFAAGCRSNGIPENVITKVWSDMQKFGMYAFNLAHSASYAYESFKTAYLKAHYPIEFIAARLSVELPRGEFDAVYKYERDAMDNFGIKFLPPDLNRSKTVYTIVADDTLLRPILGKGIGSKAGEEIVKHQPYRGKDLFLAFASKVGSMVNSKVIETMCDMGIWGKVNKAKMLRDFETVKKNKKANKGRPMGDLFD